MSTEEFKGRALVDEYSVRELNDEFSDEGEYTNPDDPSLAEALLASRNYGLTGVFIMVIDVKYENSQLSKLTQRFSFGNGSLQAIDMPKWS